MIKQIYMQSGEALGTEVELRLSVKKIEEAEELFPILWKEIYEFEKNYSRFNKESLLSQLNLNGGKPIEASPEFIDILEKSKKFHELTSGIFNPFILPKLEQSGYVVSMVPKPELEPLDYTKREVLPIEALKISGQFVSIPENGALDLGGIGKGYLLDKLGKILEGRTQDYCLSLGGDILMKGREIQKNWEIDVQSNQDRSRNIAVYIGIGSVEGIATSGRIREKSGKRQIHILNPDAEIKATGNEMCTVVAEDAITADVMASAIIVGGKEMAENLIRQGLIKAVLLQNKNDPQPFILGEGFKIIK